MSSGYLSSTRQLVQSAATRSGLRLPTETLEGQLLHLEAMNSAFQPQIILLKEGTDTSQGKAQIISNINACQAVADTVRTTLGPRGMDKLVFDGRNTTISNDGATIMKLLDIVHPAAKTLVDISMAQVQYDYSVFAVLHIH